MKTFDGKTTQIICSISLMLLNISYIISASQISKVRGWNNIENVMIMISILLVFFKIIALRIYSVNNNKTSIIFVLIASIISVISYINSGGPTVMKLFLFAFAIKDVPRKSVYKIYISSLLVGVTIVIFLSLIGILNIRWNEGNVFTFGFQNPNNLPVFFSGIIFTYNILKKNELHVGAILLELLCTILLYTASTSRTATAINIIVLSLIMFYKKYNGKFVTRLLQIWSFIGFWVYTYLSLFISSHFTISNEWWRHLNLVMSWRPYLYNRYYLRYGISILGKTIDKSSLGTLDNAYLVLMIQYGLLTLILYGVVFCTLAIHAKLEGDIITTILIVGYELFFLFEFVPLLVNVNAVLIEFLIVFLNNDDSIENRLQDNNELLSEVYND